MATPTTTRGYPRPIGSSPEEPSLTGSETEADRLTKPNWTGILADRVEKDVRFVSLDIDPLPDASFDEQGAVVIDMLTHDVYRSDGANFWLESVCSIGEFDAGAESAAGSPGYLKLGSLVKESGLQNYSRTDLSSGHACEIGNVGRYNVKARVRQTAGFGTPVKIGLGGTGVAQIDQRTAQINTAGDDGDTFTLSGSIRVGGLPSYVWVACEAAAGTKCQVVELVIERIAP